MEQTPDPRDPLSTGPERGAGSEAHRELVLTLVPILLAGTAIYLVAGWPSLAPLGLVPAPLPLALLSLAAAAAMLHRPFEGSTLGVGALVVVPVLASFGAAPAALVAGVALLLADVVRRILRRRSAHAGVERRRRLRSLVHAALLVLALLIAGAVATGGAEPPNEEARAATRLLAAAGIAYLGALATLGLGDKKLRRPDLPVPWRDGLGPLVVDAGAWAVGIAIARFVAGPGWPAAAVVIAGFALLSLEAARYALDHGLSRQRIADLERLGRATRRIAGSGHEPGFEGVAERILIECSNVLSFQWFQLELLARDVPARSWWTGPQHHLQEGVPDPPAYPPPMPGIHRRRRWFVIDRNLDTVSRRLGRLRLWCDPRQLEDDAEELLDGLLPQMTASLEKAILDRESKHDPLTGLALRRVLEERLTAAHRGSLKSGGPMAVLLCDLDHFKNVNDTYGHAAGDQALVAAARLLLAEAGPGRVAARYGGEEFTLLLEAENGDEALALAEGLRRRLEALEVVVDGHRLPLTMSLGVAAFPELHVKRPQELLELADEALYEAKRRGRNRCLLNLGPGRFRAVDGSILTREGSEAGAQAPRIFA